MSNDIKLHGLNHMLFSFREHIQKTFGRSWGWSIVRKSFLIKNPQCEICGRKTNLQVHHKKAFSIAPQLEFEESNLVTLCDGPTRCHFVFGHLGDWQSINDDIEKDLVIFKEKFKNRRTPSSSKEE